MRLSIRRPLAPLVTVLISSATLAACSTDNGQDADFEETPAQEEPAGTEPESTDDDELDNDDDDGDGDGDASDDEPGQPEDTSDGAEDDDETLDAEEPTGPLNPEDAIETISYELPGDSSTTVEVGFHGLRVEGDVMLLELSFTGEFHGGSPLNIYSMMGSAVYPELNDRENLTQYTVIGDGHDRWSTDSTNSGHRYESGQTAPYWAYYAAPVDDVDTITVAVIPGAVEFEEVEIER